MPVYFITCREANAVKIGHSGDPHIRLREVQWGCPLELKLEAIVDGTKEREASFHGQFDDDRIRGEWFRINPAIEAIIEFNPPELREKLNPKYQAPKCNPRLPVRVRKELGISQAVLASMIGVRTTEVRRYERGTLEGYEVIPPDMERQLLALLEGEAA